jgi:glyoxylase-like metal-dependent hydrolase (beta-lactamase superfamily II)
MEHAGAMKLGRIEISVVCEGAAPIELDDELPGSSVDWDAERGRHPWSFEGDAAWAWHVHAFVVRTPEGVVMVDTGLGTVAPYRPWSSSNPEAWAGIDRDDVGVVLLTHLHADHAGGSIGVTGEPAFPKARYVVHPADWEFFSRVDDAEDFTVRGAMGRLEELGMLDLTELDHEPAPGVSVRHTPGHTPGHRSVLVRDGDETLLLTGDLLHLPVQVDHPSWPSAHDEDPGIGQAARQVMLWRARHDGWTVGVSHFARPFGRVGEEGWEPL